MNQRLQYAKSCQDSIRKLLMPEWDPIGVADIPEAQDEYDSYIPGIYRLLREHADLAAIASYLNDNDIGGSTEPGRFETNRRVAEMLMNLME